MTAVPLVCETLLAFFVAATVLYRYGDWKHHHVIVTMSVLIAWYFSMLIVFILPLDVSNTIYETCLKNHTAYNITHPPLEKSNVTNSSEAVLVEIPCEMPWSYVPGDVFPVFWRIVYWTSQILTWLILPLMQSYTKAGEFLITAKLKSALYDNAIYYGSYLLIVGILLLYIALRPDVDLDGMKLRTIAATASNTWGLFWLVLLLGYGLVEVPRTIWHKASAHILLNKSYFRVTKLIHEKCETEAHLHDMLNSMRAYSRNIGKDHWLRPYMDIIESKVDDELMEKFRPTERDEDSSGMDHFNRPTEKTLVKFHKQLLRALQHDKRVETQWDLMVEEVLWLEDIHRSAINIDREFRHLVPVKRHSLIERIYTRRLEWLWECRVRPYLLKMCAVVFGIISAAVVWSELTFFVKSPTLSLFAVFVNLAHHNNNYLAIELISSVTMAYIALCAYSTLFKIRVLNLYYLAPHHLTDEYSLIFSGMMLCRLTPPMCLNFLSLIHMDSHVIADQEEETHYTQIMGHMDVIPIISDGFNVYFPMMIVALCLATYYSLGSRLLSAFGCQQFIGDNEDELMSDFIDEGRQYIAREARIRRRNIDSEQRRKEFSRKFALGESMSTLYRSARTRAEHLVRPLERQGSTETQQLGLLGDTQSHVHVSQTSFSSHPKPNTNLFDDV